MNIKTKKVKDESRSGRSGPRVEQKIVSLIWSYLTHPLTIYIRYEYVNNIVEKCLF